MRLLPLAVAIILQCVLVRTETYTNRYDTVNLDEVLSNKRLTQAYVKCMLDKGKCTQEGKELKFGIYGGHLSRKRSARSPIAYTAHIAEALQNGCKNCTKAQREGMHRVIKHLITYEKGYWKELVEKYDPKRVYTKKYEKELSSL